MKIFRSKLKQITIKSPYYGNESIQYGDDSLSDSESHQYVNNDIVIEAVKYKLITIFLNLWVKDLAWIH